MQVAPFDFPGAFSPWDVFPLGVCAPLLEEQGSSNNDASILDLNFHIFSFLVVSFSRSVNHTGVSLSALFCSRLLNVDFILKFLIIKRRFLSRLSFRRIFHPNT